MIDYNSGGIFKEFVPKVGESKVVHIRESSKVEDPSATSDDNFRNKTKNFGYRYELTLTNDRIMLLNVWKLFFAFKEPVNAELDDKGKKVPVQDGDKIQIDHPAERVYSVTILEKGTGIGVVVPDLEKEAFIKNGGKGTTAAPVTTTPASVAATPPVAAPAVATPPTAQPPVAQTPPPTGDVDLPF